MLKQIPTIVTLSVTFCGLNSLEAKLIQVDFVAELASTELIELGFDPTIEGSWVYDDATQGGGTTLFGWIDYIELIKFRLKTLRSTHRFDSGVIHYINEDAPEGIELSVGRYAVLVGQVVYPAVEDISVVRKNLDPDGDGIIDELKGVSADYVDLNEFNVFFDEVASVESPFAVIDFQTVFSMVDSKESLTPVITDNGETDNGETPTIKLFAKNGLTPFNVQASQSSAVEYEITSFSIAILVPEPSTLGLLLFGLAAYSRRRFSTERTGL